MSHNLQVHYVEHFPMSHNRNSNNNEDGGNNNNSNNAAYKYKTSPPFSICNIFTNIKLIYVIP